MKALNLVDQASCFQVMIPFHDRETSELLRKLVEDHWMRWAGPPTEAIMDPAQTMLGEALQALFESLGTSVKFIPAEAHWQLGRTEGHGGWLARVLEKVIKEHSPGDKLAWERCVKHAYVKNQMIQNYGFTPHQFVFGKNLTIPGDLLNEPLHVIPATAGLLDSEIQEAQSIRASARKAVVELQDDRALRQALLARPRVSQEFRAGELVAYWCEQKYSQAQKTVVQGGCWHGTAMIIGKVGRNYVIAHRKQIFRCAPEQLRPATSEEKTLVQTPEAELLGIKDLIEGGTFKGKQYVDSVPGQYPPTVAASAQTATPLAQLPVPADSEDVQGPAAPEVPEPSVPAPSVLEGKSGDVPDQINREEHPTIDSQVPEVPGVSNTPTEPEQSSSWYGPIRRLVHGKSDENALYRPPAMREDDFIEIMREVVPQLVDLAMKQVQSEASDRAPAMKRALEDPETPDPHRSKPSSEETMSAALDRGGEEVLLVEEMNACNHDINVLIAAHVQKKATKELPHSGNAADLQKLINESKAAEWSTILEKGAVKVHYGKKAQSLKEKHPDRFIGSHFVITRKAIEEGVNVNVDDPTTHKIKSRWVIWTLTWTGRFRMECCNPQL